MPGSSHTVQRGLAEGFGLGQIGEVGALNPDAGLSFSDNLQPVWAATLPSSSVSVGQSDV